MKPLTKDCKEYFHTLINEDIKSKESQLKHYKQLNNPRIEKEERQKTLNSANEK